MALVEPKELYKNFETGELKPLYFLFGEEPYLIEQSLLRFKEALLSDGDMDFNYSAFYAADAEVERVRDAVETLPMMKDRRYVLLKEAHELNDKEWADLEPLFSSPVTSTVFVITATKVDKRKKSVKALLEKGLCVEFKKPYDNQLPSWIKYIAEAKGLAIDDEAIHQLHRLVGNNLSEVDAALVKLSEYIGSRTRIDASDVLQVVSCSKEENVFDFTRAVGRADRVSALEQLVHLLDQGQSEVGIVSLLARHIRILMMVKKGQEMSLGSGKLAQFAQIPPYFLESYVDQARHWSLKKLESILYLLCETDKALKSSPLSSHIWLENLVLKACDLAIENKNPSVAFTIA